MYIEKGSVSRAAAMRMEGNMLKQLCLATAALALSGCASANLGTTSGNPELRVLAPPARAQALIAQACVSRNWSIAVQSPTEVQCRVPMNAVQSVLVQTMIGNAYSTPPQGFVRVTIVEMDDGAFLQAVYFVQTQMAFGQNRSVESRNAETLQNLQSLLEEVAATARAAPSAGARATPTPGAIAGAMPSPAAAAPE